MLNDWYKEEKHVKTQKQNPVKVWHNQYLTYPTLGFAERNMSQLALFMDESTCDVIARTFTNSDHRSLPRGMRASWFDKDPYF